MCECEERANANSSSDRFCVKDVAEIHWLAKILERLSWKICVCMLRIVKYETFRNFVSAVQDLQKREHFEGEYQYEKIRKIWKTRHTLVVPRTIRDEEIKKGRAEQ